MLVALLALVASVGPAPPCYHTGRGHRCLADGEPFATANPAFLDPPFTPSRPPFIRLLIPNLADDGTMFGYRPSTLRVLAFAPSFDGESRVSIWLGHRELWSAKPSQCCRDTRERTCACSVVEEQSKWGYSMFFSKLVVDLNCHGVTELSACLTTHTADGFDLQACSKVYVNLRLIDETSSSLQLGKAGYLNCTPDAKDSSRTGRDGLPHLHSGHAVCYGGVKGVGNFSIAYGVADATAVVESIGPLYQIEGPRRLALLHYLEGRVRNLGSPVAAATDGALQRQRTRRFPEPGTPVRHKWVVLGARCEARGIRGANFGILAAQLWLAQGYRVLLVLLERMHVRCRARSIPDVDVVILREDGDTERVDGFEMSVAFFAAANIDVIDERTYILVPNPRAAPVGARDDSCEEDPTRQICVWLPRGSVEIHPCQQAYFVPAAGSSLVLNEFDAVGATAKQWRALMANGSLVSATSGAASLRSEMTGRIPGDFVIRSATETFVRAVLLPSAKRRKRLGTMDATEMPPDNDPLIQKTLGAGLARYSARLLSATVTVLPPAYRRLVEAARRQVATVLMTELPRPNAGTRPPHGSRGRLSPIQPGPFYCWGLYSKNRLTFRGLRAAS